MAEHYSEDRNPVAAPIGGEYYVFRDTVHNVIEIDDEVEGRFLRYLLDTREIQRLRRIKQNGFASFVYSPLEGTRFQHSLGAYHVARRLIRLLKDKQPDEADGFPDVLRITDHDLISFPIAALVHDIGHGPFSHIWEECFAKEPMLFGHEIAGLDILRSTQSEVGRALDKPGEFTADFSVFNGIKEDVLAFLEKRHRLYYLLPLLSGNLDVDRLDFISRDTQSAGVTYGANDLEWILRSVRFARLDESNLPGSPLKWVVAIDGRKGKATLSQYLRARENMYRLVYHHKTSRIMLIMLKNLFCRLKDLMQEGRQVSFATPALGRWFWSWTQGERFSADDLLQLDDTDIWVSLKAWASDTDDVVKEIAEGLLTRRLFKYVETRSHVFQIIEKLNAPENGGYLTNLISHDKLQFSKYYYGFDCAEFDVVGKNFGEDNAWQEVWMINSSPLGNVYENLRDYWRRALASKMDVRKRGIIVSARYRKHVSALANRIAISCPSKDDMILDERKLPSFVLISKISAGAHKEVYFGARKNVGSVENLLAIKIYKEASSVTRDVMLPNFLTSIDNQPGRTYLTFAEIHPGDTGASETAIVESLWDRSLEAHVKERGAFRNIVGLLTLGFHLYSGLAALHSVDLRHTDIKPDNCGFRGRNVNNRIYSLGDFGCISRSPNEIPSRELAGTYRTRAPECFGKAPQIGLLSDVWALGVTIYAICRKRYWFMDFGVPHAGERHQAAEDDLHKQVAEVGRDPAKYVDIFRKDVSENLPPVIVQSLNGAFDDFGSRASAKVLAEQFKSSLARIESMKNGKISVAWRLAEDGHQAFTRLEKKEPSTLRRFMAEINELREYIPPSLFRDIEAYAKV